MRFEGHWTAEILIGRGKGKISLFGFGPGPRGQNFSKSFMHEPVVVCMYVKQATESRIECAGFRDASV